jgi:hypothetical protein
MGIPIEQTALLIGRSVRWTTKVHNEFIRAGESTIVKRPGTGGRRRQNMSRGAAKEFLEPFFLKTKEDGILVVAEIHQALEERLARKVALASAYNLLHRNRWRKLSPGKGRVAADVEAQEAWKKIQGNDRRGNFGMERRFAAQVDVSGRGPIWLDFRSVEMLVSQAREADMRRHGFSPIPVCPFEPILGRRLLRANAACRGQFAELDAHTFE